MSSIILRPHIFAFNELQHQSRLWEEPNSLAVGQHIKYCGNSIYKLKHNEIVIDTTTNNYFYLIGYDELREVRVGTTNDPSYLGMPTTKVTNEFAQAASDINWQDMTDFGITVGNNGILYVEKRPAVFDYLDFYARYNYLIDRYEITHLNLNPKYNLDVKDKTVAFFMRPTYGFTDFRDQTLFYLIASAEGTIEETDYWWDSYLPTYTDSTYFEQAIGGDQNLMILGEITPRDPDLLDFPLVAEARMPGGGLKEQYWSVAENLQPQSKWYTGLGFWDGEPIPDGGSLKLKIPRDILELYGGSYKEDQILDILKEHTMFGSLVIPEYTSKEIMLDASWIVIDTLSGDTGLVFGWTDLGPMRYKIYLRELGEVNFTLKTTLNNPTVCLYTDSTELNAYSIYEGYITAENFEEFIKASTITIIQGPNAPEWTGTIQPDIMISQEKQGMIPIIPTSKPPISNRIALKDVGDRFISKSITSMRS